VEGTAAPTTRKTILLVDDDHDARAIFGTLFELAGFDVLHASDGAAAVEVARNNPPDLVLLNLVMPRMSGYQVLRRLRSQRETAEVPCLLFTGDARPEQMGTALMHGADGFVTKPAEPRAVLRIVRQILAEPSSS
jgi:DNA-binding response OmpR family regulator